MGIRSAISSWDRPSTFERSRGSCPSSDDVADDVAVLDGVDVGDEVIVEVGLVCVVSLVVADDEADVVTEVVMLVDGDVVALLDVVCVVVGEGGVGGEREAAAGVGDTGQGGGVVTRHEQDSSVVLWDKRRANGAIATRGLAARNRSRRHAKH